MSTLPARAAAVYALTLVLSACDDGACRGRLADACRKAEDLAYLVGVQIGDATSQGNAIITRGGALHATGKIDLALRTRVMSRDNARFGNVTVRTDSTVGGSSFAVDQGTVSTISADLAVGGLPGFRVGETRVGGLDLLAGLGVTTGNGGDGGLRLGNHSLSAGLRLGLIEETRSLPSVSVTAMARAIATISATVPPLPTDNGATVNIRFEHVDVGSLGVRFAASKRLGRFGLSAGYGRDTYHPTIDYAVTATDVALDSASRRVAFSIARQTAFGGASLTLGSATIGAEVGRLFGGGMPPMTNTFGSLDANAPRTYLTFGVRIPAGRTNDGK
jgi:hypothetical protein